MDYLFKNKSFLRFAVLIFFFTFLLYGNSIKNKYSLDDEIVTLNNERVEMGIKGIPIILRTFYSIDDKSHYEYRPLVLISYAIEYELFGRNPHISHIINILIYAITCVMLFYIISRYMSTSMATGGNTPVAEGDFKYFLFPLLATLLFAAHPIHTEVVDNLKSRDELLAFLNSIIASVFFIQFSASDNKKALIYGFTFLFLAMLSKKTATVFIILVPLILYFFTQASFRKILLIAGISTLAILCYVVFKKIMVPENPLRVFHYFENPLFVERELTNFIPAGLYTIWKYVELLVFPHPLSYYYGYNQVPVAGWAHPKVWLSLLFYTAVFMVALAGIKQKKIYSFAILFFLFALFPFSNLTVPVVGIIGERFIYTASFGFSLLFAWLLMKLYPLNEKSGKKKPFTSLTGFSILSVLTILLYSFKTITRNPDWKDHLTLYRKDIKHLDKSAKAHAMISNTIYPGLFSLPAGIQKDNLIKESAFHYKKSLEIYPDYIVSNNNLGTIYFTFYGDFNSALPYFRHATRLDTNYLEAFYNLGYTYEKLGISDSAILCFEKALKLKPNYAAAYERLYNVYFSEGRLDDAIHLNLRAANHIPDYKAMYYVNAGNVYSSKNDTLMALNYFLKAFETEPWNKDLCLHIAKVYQRLSNHEKADEYFRKAEAIK